MTHESHAQTPSVVLLLGAGASKEADIPLVEQLAEGFRDSLSDSATLRDAYDWLWNRLHEHPDVKAGKAKVDIEYVLSALRELETFSSSILLPFLDRWIKGKKAHDHHFEPLIDRIESYIRDSCSIDVGKLAYLRPIGSLLSISDPVDVFTLNYDCSIEAVCQELGVEYTDGFGTYWEPERFDQIKSGVRLHKLHGSLTWFATSRRPTRLVKMPVRLTGEQPTPRFFTDEKVSISLLYPSLAKEQHVEPYATLIANLRSALRRADYLVCIGYSFRDSYLHDLVTDVLKENQGLVMLFVSPNASELVRASDTFSSTGARFTDHVGRIETAHRKTSGALADGWLMRWLSNHTTTSGEIVELNRAAILGHPADGDARRALLTLADSPHVAAILTLFREDPTGVWHRAIQGVSGSDVVNVLLLVLALHRADQAVTDHVRNEVRRWFSGVSEFAIAQDEHGQPIAVREPGHRTSVAMETARRWFAERSALVKSQASRILQLSRECAIHTPESEQMLGRIGSDLVKVSDYFSAGARGDDPLVGTPFAGSLNLLQPRGTFVASGVFLDSQSPSAVSELNGVPASHPESTQDE